VLLTTHQDMTIDSSLFRKIQLHHFASGDEYV